MDNQSIQPIQPIQTSPTVPPVPPMEKKKNVELIKTIAIIAISLVAVAFIGLFTWIFMQYKQIRTDVQGQIDTAVAEAKVEQASELEAEFAEREKSPYSTFAGPVDYGQLTFKYPKTWSVYIESDANDGKDFNAYLNPGQVETVSKDTINALRVTIENKSYENVVEEYQRNIDRKDSGLSVESVTIGKTADGKGITANRYTGTIPGTDLSGYIVIFKIRDKTAILQTDSVLFKADFDQLLTTVEFNA